MLVGRTMQSMDLDGNSDKCVIRQLDSQTARRICSGQVITSMAVAVKELLENAMDAGSTCITIRFFDFGKEQIEVIDNGIGIEADNFGTLGHRNCTSKLIKFEDLKVIETFGFRGEAVNSLCNIANVKIHTRHANASIGTVLLFDTQGQITSKQMVARDVGTTVTLSQLFYPLPVRRKELLANVKRSFDKTLALIYQYCIGMIGLKIICSHANKSGAFSTLFISTGISIQSNIIEIFEYKQFSNLMPFVCHKDLENLTLESNYFDITGYISKPDTGCGRSSSDRQYFYLNNRPCDLSQLGKRINQIYRNYNRYQYPFILLKIKIGEKIIDRNLTPDKRMVLLADNHDLLRVVEHSLEKMFCRDSAEILSMTQGRDFMSSFLKRSMSSASEISDNQISKIRKRSASPCDDLLLDDSRSECESLNNISHIITVPEQKDNSNGDLSCNIEQKSSQIIFDNQNTTKPTMHPFFASFKVPLETSLEYNCHDKQVPKTTLPINHEHVEENSDESVAKTEKTFSHSNTASNSSTLLEDNDDLEEVFSKRSCQVMDISLTEIFEQFTNMKQRMNESGGTASKYKAKIVPEENEEAENELKHLLLKQSFSEMQVIGQFNLGFIITKFKSDLFIVDQHAIDERYNYERFLQDPGVNHQNLVCPMSLRLSAINEMVVMDNLSTFHKLGFGIIVNKEAASGERVLLTRIPLGKEWVGGRSDVEEIIAVIRESSTGDIFRNWGYIPSGLKREIGYRACRSSVMIGEAVSRSNMEKMIKQMSALRDPWHCAHNRPTIRHLVSLTRLTDSLSSILENPV